MEKVVVLIPARHGSSRFPGKPLALISGKSMIERVYTNCRESGFETAVVTDHDGIEAAVKAFGGKVIRVDDDVPSGSERIALGFERFYLSGSPDLVINVQGDEPLLKGSVIRELAEFHLKSTYDIATLIRERSVREEDFKNPNVVKAVWSAVSKQCFYFSRESLPYDRDGGRDYSWYQHIGVYSYRPKVLARFVKLPMSELEDLEKLEQLRGLENQMTIGAILTTGRLIGVDVPEDIKKVEGVLIE
ncbi:MAG TPA: 3-deoxy-manno-octulosonate cytidylyltransferase [Bacteriovoracaceae bacterium]|nr:3-deoxy-manno-octulosonate cytidylyltransferase [Bacteriovoracaceae bacterium]